MFLHTYVYQALLLLLSLLLQEEDTFKIRLSSYHFYYYYTFPFFVQLSSSTLTTVWFHSSTFYYSCSTFRHSSFIPVIHHGSVANAGEGRNMRIGCISTIDINVIPYHSNRALLHSRLTSLRQIFQIIRR